MEKKSTTKRMKKIENLMDWITTKKDWLGELEKDLQGLQKYWKQLWNTNGNENGFAKK